MPGFSKGIGTHEIHSMHMALSFLSSAGPPHLDLDKIMRPEFIRT